MGRLEVPQPTHVAQVEGVLANTAEASASPTACDVGEPMLMGTRSRNLLVRAGGDELMESLLQRFVVSDSLPGAREISACNASATSRPTDPGVEADRPAEPKRLGLSFRAGDGGSRTSTSKSALANTTAIGELPGSADHLTLVCEDFLDQSRSRCSHDSYRAHPP